MLSPSLILNLVIGCGVISVLYGFISSKQILSASPGNAKMQEIASAIQIGAKAYLALAGEMLRRKEKTASVVA